MRATAPRMPRSTRSRPFGTQKLVLVEPLRLALLLRNVDGYDLAREPPRRSRRRGLLLRPQRERVLVAARHVVLLRDVLGGLAHRIGTIRGAHLRVDES